jgi:hypothetical protein
MNVNVISLDKCYLMSKFCVSRFVRVIQNAVAMKHS